MDKLYNLEKMIEYVEKAYDNLEEAEDSWDENVLEEEIQCKIVEMKEELGKIFDSLRERS